MKLAALIPTYRRPAHLRGCLDALARGELAPAVIVVVVRDGDDDSVAVLDAFAPVAGAAGIELIRGVVQVPGHLPPLVAGRVLVPDDVDAVVIVDDDLFVAADALYGIAALLQDPTIGAIAGHAIEHDEGVRRPPVRGRGGGHVSWWGTIYAGHSHDGPRGARDVDWAAGLLAAYRKDVFDGISIRASLNADVAVGYEVDWGLQVRAQGWRIVYDPAIRGDHHNAPRNHGSQRHERTPNRVYWQNRNHVYLMLHHIRGPRRLAYLLNVWLAGRGDWAIGTALNALVRRRSLEWWGLLGAAYRGKLDGLVAFARAAR
jgi:GT2 family glycosyltransferase